MKGKPYCIEGRFSIIFLIFLSSLILNTIHGEWGKDVNLQCSLVLLSTYLFFPGRQKPAKTSVQGAGVGGVHANRPLCSYLTSLVFGALQLLWSQGDFAYDSHELEGHGQMTFF